MDSPSKLIKIENKIANNKDDPHKAFKKHRFILPEGDRYNYSKKDQRSEESQAKRKVVDLLTTWFGKEKYARYLLPKFIDKQCQQNLDYLNKCKEILEQKKAATSTIRL